MLVSLGIHRFGAWPYLFRYRTAVAVPLPSPSGQIGEEQASQLSKLALEGIDREYPNKPAHVLTGASSLVSPKEMHPAFFGCFDWHSSVHGHWMLVRLLKQHPQHARSAEAKKVLQEHLTREKIEVEAAYFGEKRIDPLRGCTGGLGSCDLWPNSIPGTIHRLGLGERTSSHWRRRSLS